MESTEMQKVWHSCNKDAGLEDVSWYKKAERCLQHLKLFANLHVCKWAQKHHEDRFGSYK